jgi:hypothetical protein
MTYGVSEKLVLVACCKCGAQVTRTAANHKRNIYRGRKPHCKRCAKAAKHYWIKSPGGARGNMAGAY